MLSGKKFRLMTPTAAVEETGNRKVATLMSAGSIINVISGPVPGDPMVHVTSDEKRFQMFAEDVRQRGEEIN